MRDKFRLVYVGLFGVLAWNLTYFLVPSAYSWITFLVGLPVVLFLPGLCTAYLLGARRLSLATFLYTVAFSVFEIMLLGLATNYIPEWLGFVPPLQSGTIYIAFNALIGALLTMVGLLNRKKQVAFSVPHVHYHKLDWAITSSTVLIVLLSILGTFRLNNGASNVLSMISLFLILATIALTLVVRARLNTLTLALVIFNCTLSILFMTSLRSWFITGHDMQHEFQVYSLTTNLGKWNIANYRDAYNACLSITILPVMLSHLLHISGTFVFKVIFQLFFALSPLTIFILLRKFIDRTRAFIGAIFFISLPTFSIDVPIISRQEIAFVFLALLLVGWFCREEAWIRDKWKVIFITMSAGVIVSHYSTAYLYITTLLISYVIFRIYDYMQKYKKPKLKESFAVSGRLVIIVFLGGFLWFSQATHTSSGLISVLKGSFADIPGLLSQDSRSTAINSIVPGINGSANQQLYNYINTTKTNPSENAGDIQNNLIFTTTSVPASPTANTFKKYTHIDVGDLNNTFYYGIGPRLYQLLIIIGLIYLFVPARRKRFKVPIQYLMLCWAAIFVLLLQVILPNISQDYGVTRAFIQAFVVLALPMIIGIEVVVKAVRPMLVNMVTGGLAILFLAIYSGFIPQFLGGIHAQLSLNNNGQYFGAYYVHRSDVTAFSWIEQNTPKGSTVNIANYAAAFAYHPRYPFNINTPGILPFQIPDSNYVLLSYSQTKDNVYYLPGNLTAVNVTTKEYANRNLLYSTGQTQFYR